MSKLIKVVLFGAYVIYAFKFVDDQAHGEGIITALLALGVASVFGYTIFNAFWDQQGEVERGKLIEDRKRGKEIEKERELEKMRNVAKVKLRSRSMDYYNYTKVATMTTHEKLTRDAAMTNDEKELEYQSWRQDYLSRNPGEPIPEPTLDNFLMNEMFRGY